METDIIKEFLLDGCSPRIFNCPFQDFYNRYVYFVIQKGHKPVSKNKFSRFLKKYGFETKVIRNQYTGICERIIIMQEHVLSYLENQLKSQEKEKEKSNNETKNRN